MSSHRWIPAMLLLFSALLHELSGLARAGITVGQGGVAPGFFGPFNQSMMGSVQPIRKIELTDRNCDPNALSRIADDRICNKYYVCFNGKYAGLFCPTGMAFDYGLQECHFKNRVDCSRREFLAAGTLTTTETSVTTPDPMETIPPMPQPATTTPQSFTMKPATVRLPATQSVLTSPHRRPIVSPPFEQQVTKTTGVSGNVMTLSLGAKVMIPFGSTIFLPAGTQIQMESGRHHSSSGHHSSGHHSSGQHHRRDASSTPVDGIASPDRDGDPIPALTRNSSDDDMANDASHQATDVGDDTPISDYDDDDQSVVPDNKTEDGSIDIASFRDDIQ